MNRSQDEALVSLLADDCPRVRSMVRDEVQRRGLALAPVLRRYAEGEAPFPSVRVAAREMLESLERDSIDHRLQAVFSTPTPDLLEGYLTLAGLETPSLAREEVTRPLAQMSRDLAALLPEDDEPASPQTLALLLAQVLGEQHDLRGDVTNYYDIRNSLLPSVLERRLGIPISLSAIYLLVGRSCGLVVHGVGMPSHFLVQVGEGRGAVCLDPFNRGKILDRDECHRMLTGITTDADTNASLLDPVSDRILLRRAVTNLVLIAEQSGDTERLMRWHRVLAHLR